jgi:hypothetical protein
MALRTTTSPTTATDASPPDATGWWEATPPEVMRWLLTSEKGQEMLHALDHVQDTAKAVESVRLSFPSRHSCLTVRQPSDVSKVDGPSAPPLPAQPREKTEDILIDAAAKLLIYVWLLIVLSYLVVTVLPFVLRPAVDLLCPANVAFVSAGLGAALGDLGERLRSGI